MSSVRHTGHRNRHDRGLDAMATQGGNARSMAAGVSMATIPTMSGMIASLSGLVGTTYLKRKVEYETELFEDQLTLDH